MRSQAFYWVSPKSAQFRGTQAKRGPNSDRLDGDKPVAARWKKPHLDPFGNGGNVVEMAQLMDEASVRARHRAQIAPPLSRERRATSSQPGMAARDGRKGRHREMAPGMASRDGRKG